MSFNTFKILAIFASIMFIGICIGAPLFIVFLFDQSTRRKHKKHYHLLRSKYQTNCVGVFRLYGGLPLPSSSMCEVAFCGNTLHIVNEHYRMAIPVEDINNIYIDKIQESYTETTYSGGGPVLGGLGLLNGIIGNASRRSAAHKNLLIINHRSGVISFHKTSPNGFDYMSPDEKQQLSGIHRLNFCIVDWIIIKFIEQRYLKYENN